MGWPGISRRKLRGVPHVVRMAGSDAGRLWRHPQFEALYDHVLRSAATVIATGIGRRTRDQARRSIPSDRGRRRLRGAARICFARTGPRSILPRYAGRSSSDPELRDLLWGGFAGDLPYFGIYGKLGDTKGSFALLAAMQRLKHAGLEVGLVAMAHGGRRSKANSARGRRSSASPTASCKFRSCRTGGCPSSCAPVSPCAASSRISRSYSTPRHRRARC